MIRSLLVLAAPFLDGLVAVEALASAARRDGVHRWRDTLANVGVGMGAFFADHAWLILAWTIYDAVWRLTPLRIPTHEVASWVALFFLDDLAYYAFHRASHRCRFLWASHATHHSSERYNLSTGLRQSWTGGALSWVFWVPLALVGFHPLMILTMQGLNLLYQFVLHTEYVRRLDWLGLVLNTPSHHRAHHGRDAPYIDRNYAGVLIIWDKLFGTFEPEHGEVRYGLTTPLASHNPLKIVFAEYVAIGRDVLRARSLLEGVGRVVASPDWQPGRPFFKSALAPRALRKPMLFAGLTLAWLPFVAAYAGEEYVRGAIVEYATPHARTASGWVVESGVVPGEPGTEAVSRLRWIAPSTLRLEAVAPARFAGDVLALDGDTLVIFSRERNAAVRVRHVPRSPGARTRGVLDRELARYKFAASPVEKRLGREVVPWTAQPLAGAPAWTFALDLEHAWPLAATLAGGPLEATYAFALRDSSWDEPLELAPYEPPESASLLEWDLARAADVDPITDRDFEPLVPKTAPAKRRFVRARASWPCLIAVVDDAPPFFTVVAQGKDRGLFPLERGVPIRLRDGRATLQLAGETVVVGLRRAGVEAFVFTNLPVADALELAESLGR